MRTPYKSIFFQEKIEASQEEIDEALNQLYFHFENAELEEILSKLSKKEWNKLMKKIAKDGYQGELDS